MAYMPMLRSPSRSARIMYMGTSERSGHAIGGNSLRTQRNPLAMSYNDDVSQLREMGPPMVSVVVVTYQHAAYIEECLNGILMQRTDFPIEILIGEDESTDGTREICQQYATDHPDRIRLFERSRKDVIRIMGKETGRSNFKGLIAESRGRYIAVCEGDDYWIDPLKLQKQVDILERDASVSLVFHNVWIKHGESRYDRFLNFGLVGDRFSASEILSREWFIGTASICARSRPLKRALEGFDFSLSGDMVLQFHAALEGDFVFLDEVASIYRRNSGGLSEAYWSTTGQQNELAKRQFEVFRPNQVWLLHRFRLKVADGHLRDVINKRMWMVARMVMEYRVRCHPQDALITIEDLVGHLRKCLLSSSPPDEQDPELTVDSEMGGLIREAAVLVWGQQVETNLRSVSASGRPIACIGLCLRMFTRRQYARRELSKWAALCIPWYLQGLWGGRMSKPIRGHTADRRSKRPRFD